VRRPPRPPADPAALTAEVRAAGQAAGLAAVGVCRARPWTRTRSLLEVGRAAGRHGGMAFTYRNPARSTEPQRVLAHARTLVVGAWSYAQRPADPPVRPANARVARYATTDAYAELEAALGAVATVLRAAGHRAVVMADDNSVVDREAAWRAGIGFVGKNANVLLPGRGSWFVLGSVVTDAALVTGPAPVAEQCGACRRCLDGCPTGAIVAPGVVDARRCLSWLLQRPGTFPPEHRVALGDRLYGCDDCQEVCPPSRREEAAAPRAAASAGYRDPLALLALADADLLAACERWYVPDRDPSVLRRNLLLVLGNAADPTDPGVRAAVARWAASSDPVLAEHAAWAAARLDVRARSGRLVDAPATDEDGPA